LQADKAIEEAAGFARVLQTVHLELEQAKDAAGTAREAADAAVARDRADESAKHQAEVAELKAQGLLLAEVLLAFLSQHQISGAELSLC